MQSGASKTGIDEKADRRANSGNKSHQRQQRCAPCFRTSNFSVDGTQIAAWASMKSLVAKDGSDEPMAGVPKFDPQTRSELQTSNPYPSKNYKRDTLVASADGSVDSSA
jgi:hypothetical protein